MRLGYLACLFAAAALTSCASLRDPTLASGVTREGAGFYSSSEMGFNDPMRSAIAQCKLDGDKKLEIVTSTSEKGMASGKDYAKLIFKCE